MNLITPSLLNSWKYYLSVEDLDKEEEQRKKILATFRREDIPKTPMMDFGCEFEEDVRGISGTVSVDGEYLAAVNHVREIVRGGTWQMPVSKQYKDFLLYGRPDVVLGNGVYDIKTTQRYDVGKFRDSAQHRLYLYCTDLEYCEYIVLEVYLKAAKFEMAADPLSGKPVFCDIAEDRGVSIKALSSERYTNRDIEPMVDEFISWLGNDPELKRLYYDNWKCKY